MGAFNGSGTFVRSYSWTTDAANSIKITASRMDTEDTGFANGLTNCLTRDGQSPALANIPMGGFKITGLANGTVATDAAAFGQLSGYAPLAGATFTGKVITVATAVGTAGFNVPAGTAPAAPVAGDFWNVGGALFYYTGAATRQLATLDGSETLTNKTLTAAVINGGTVTPIAAPLANNPGTLGIPQLGKTASYTLTMAETGFDIYLTGTTAAQTITIPANGTVAYPIGAVITISNDSTQNWSIAITTDTLLWSPSGGTGTRTLAPSGKAVLEKKTATRWWISGSGLT